VSSTMTAHGSPLGNLDIFGVPISLKKKLNINLVKLSYSRIDKSSL
jgi:hypothetical protein